MISEKEDSEEYYGGGYNEQFHTQPIGIPSLQSSQEEEGSESELDHPMTQTTKTRKQRDDSDDSDHPMTQQTKKRKQKDSDDED